MQTSPGTAMLTSTVPCCSSIPALPAGTTKASGRLAAAWHQALAAVAGWWQPRATARAHRELDSLVHLSDSVLRDIGVPDSLRAQAAQRREQEQMLRRLEARHGSGLPHW
jgi:hypothetical protein